MSTSDFSSLDLELRERIGQFWDKHCDPYMIQLPLFHSPIIYVSSLIALCLLVQLVDWLFQFQTTFCNANSKKRWSILPDVRPILLVHNGFCFGVYGVALMILSTQSKLANLLYACEAPVITDFHQQAIKHTVYTYHLVSFAYLLDPLIRAIGQRRVDVAAQLVHQTAWSFLLMIYSCLNPVGITMGIVMLDAAHNVCRFGASVLSIADSKHKDKSQRSGSKIEDGMRSLFFSVISAHAYQTQSFIRSHSCRPPTLTSQYYTGIFFPIAVYSAIVSALSLLRMVSHLLPSQDKMEKQVLSSGRNLRKKSRLAKIPVANDIK